MVWEKNDNTFSFLLKDTVFFSWRCTSSIYFQCENGCDYAISSKFRLRDYKLIIEFMKFYEMPKSNYETVYVEQRKNCFLSQQALIK